MFGHFEKPALKNLNYVVVFFSFPIICSSETNRTKTQAHAIAWAVKRRFESRPLHKLATPLHPLITPPAQENYLRNLAL